jgi:hypothetical protein
VEAKHNYVVVVPDVTGDEKLNEVGILEMMIRQCIDRPAEFITEECLIRKLSIRVFNRCWKAVITRAFIVVESQVIGNR